MTISICRIKEGKGLVESHPTKAYSVIQRAGEAVVIPEGYWFYVIIPLSMFVRFRISSASGSQYIAHGGSGVHLDYLMPETPVDPSNLEVSYTSSHNYLTHQL